MGSLPLIPFSNESTHQALDQSASSRVALHQAHPLPGLELAGVADQQLRLATQGILRTANVEAEHITKSGD